MKKRWMVEKKQKDTVQKRETKWGVEKGNENISPQKNEFKKKEWKHNFSEKRRDLFFSTKSWNGQRKTFLGFFLKARVIKKNIQK